MMGWSSVCKGSETTIEYFTRMFTWGDNEVLDIAFKNFSTVYIAVKNTTDKENPQVWASVVLVRFSRGDYNMTYKEMSECSGPGESECPERILKLLTPTDNEYALQWRERCWENIRAKKKRMPLEKDAIIKFDEAISFTDGNKYSLFKILNAKRMLVCPVTIFKGNIKVSNSLLQLNRKVFRTHSYHVATAADLLPDLV